MKLKQQPEDFQVEELTEVTPGGQGPFALYRLEKRGWTTHDAVYAICRRWKLDTKRFSFGGLKDRHAHTIQYLTIFHGPRRNLTLRGVALEYLGMVKAPYDSEHIKANRFHITLRDLDQTDCDSAVQAIEEVKTEGLPNYFDDQRFGSVVGQGGFVAKLLVLGQFEEALRLALTSPYEFDRGDEKREKAVLRKHWGDWPACKEKLSPSFAREMAGYLISNPGDFRGVAARLRPDMRTLYLSAYQSHLWNRMLARWISRNCQPSQVITVRLRLGSFPMHSNLDENQRQTFRNLSLPFPTARLHLEPGHPHEALIQEILAEEGLELRQLKIKGIREMFFSKGERPALCLPEYMTCEMLPDDRHPDKFKLVLDFQLGRGAYATLIVKRITNGSR